VRLVEGVGHFLHFERPELLDDYAEFLLVAELDVTELTTSERPALRSALLDYGGLLLRGFPLYSTAAFRNFVRLFLGNQDSYLAGASKRHRVRAPAGFMRRAVGMSRA